MRERARRDEPQSGAVRCCSSAVLKTWYCLYPKLPREKQDREEVHTAIADELQIPALEMSPLQGIAQF